MVKCREEGKGLIKREERRRGRDMVGSSLFNLPFCRALDFLGGDCGDGKLRVT